MENTESHMDYHRRLYTSSTFYMQCTDGNNLFSKVRSSPMLHHIPNTLQYSPGLYNETDITECTTWYIMDHFLTTMRSRLYIWYCTSIYNSKSYAEEGTVYHRNDIKIGLQINHKKTPVMCMNHKKERP